MKVYNHAETLAMLNEVADEVGRNTVYRDIRKADMPEVEAGSCYNVHRRSDGTIVPGCIVGQVVVKKLGVPALELWEGSNGFIGTARMSAGDLGEWLRSNKGIEFTERAAELLRAVQRKQDGGSEWGDAIAFAMSGAYMSGFSDDK